MMPGVSQEGEFGREATGRSLGVSNKDLLPSSREAGVGNRTPDLLITSEPLCHLSYAGLQIAAPQDRYREQLSLEVPRRPDKTPSGSSRGQGR
jgi:hypothetical protein